jgi:ATP-dependent Lon protease
MTKVKINNLPILPLRDIVMFPGMVAPLFVGRDKSIKALEYAIHHNQKVLMVTQKDSNIDDPKANSIYRIGVVGTILQLLKLPDGTVKALVEAEERRRIKKIVAGDAIFIAETEGVIETIINDEVEKEAMMRSVLNQFDNYVKLNKRIAPEIISSLGEIKNASQLSDIIASHLFIKISEKQKILEMLNIADRLEYIYSVIESEIDVLNTEKKIKTRVKKQIEKTQKEYYLNEQLKAIHKELSEGDESKNELGELEKQIEKIDFTKEAKEKASAELKKLKMMNPISAEATVSRNYLDWLLSMPWGKFNEVKIDLNDAKNILDQDHYGLDKVKERILEYLAVQKRVSKIKGPILCLVGPPGVGKTSLAKSIASATNREFVRMSLGGVRDESEIRGHRKTYIGSMPGKIIQYLKKAKSSNPVFLLDEIDKIGVDFRGDPASALLEVLDPEQNNKFVDHYLEVEYNLSDVMFIATANSLNIPKALLDRMEVIRVSSYTEEEKLEIAKRHLVKKQKDDHGLQEKELSISDDSLLDLIRCYTREAGVRNLEREIANLARKSIKKIVSGINKSIKITAKNLSQYAGTKKFSYGEIENSDLTGVATGLAYTEVGGEILSIEALATPGKGNIKATGKLGEVMQESAQAAFSYFKSRSTDVGVTPEDYLKKDIHLHVPEGATNKDGPSAGIAIFTSIVSIMTGVAVKKTVAMTGEITLRGRVLAIGGLREKLLAAIRGGIKTVIIPKDNLKDLDDMPLNVRKKLNIIGVSSAFDVLSIALIFNPSTLLLKEKNINLPKMDHQVLEDLIAH